MCDYKCKTNKKLKEHSDSNHLKQNTPASNDSNESSEKTLPPSCKQCEDAPCTCLDIKTHGKTQHENKFRRWFPRQQTAGPVWTKEQKHTDSNQEELECSLCTRLLKLGDTCVCKRLINPVKF